VQGDKRGIRNEFGNRAADACMQEGARALEYMVGELKNFFQDPHTNIHRNLFPRR